MPVRLTDVPGVSHKQPRTRQGALSALRAYEESNSDLPPNVRRLLGLAAIGRYFGRRCLEAALQTPLPKAPFRDWSWRWWNVLLTSGLEEHWNDFAGACQHNGVRAGAHLLRTRCTEEQYRLFLRRAGTNPHNDHRAKRGHVLWTKGGCWRIESPFTRLLVLNKHLPKRPLVRWWQRKLGHNGVKLLEQEIMNAINPDVMFRGDAIQSAVDYYRWRLPRLLQWSSARASAASAAWFFQTAIPDREGTVAPDSSGWYTRRSRQKPGVLVKRWSF
jgi:hypothetical protein